MPAEIADSDADSDSNSPKAPAYSPIEENGLGVRLMDLEGPDPIDSLNFSQYLSPTQRLSSAVEGQDPGIPQSTGSTDRFFKAIGPPRDDIFDSRTTDTNDSPNTSRSRTSGAKHKRSYSDIENGFGTRRENREERRETSKRSKTYGQSRSQRSDATSSLFSELADLSQNDQQQSQQGRLDHTPVPAKPAQLKQQRMMQGLDSMAGQEHHSRRPTNLGANGLQKTSHSFSTTKSSVGGYQGYELDYRGAGMGLHNDANPFGDPSQNSLVDDIEPTGLRSFPGSFARDGMALGGSNDTIDVSRAPQESALQQMATSPVRNSDGKNVLKSGRASKSTTGNESASALTEPKKRGRKPKNAKAAVSTVTVEDQELDELQLIDDLSQQPSGAGISELISRERGTASKADKKKRKKPAASETNKASSSKELTSDLGLSDPITIGMPKEIYNPRPSRSRSNVILEEDDEEDSEASLELPHDDPVVPLSDQDKTSYRDRPAKQSSKKGRAKKAKKVVEEDEDDIVYLETKPASVEPSVSLRPGPTDAKRKDDEELPPGLDNEDQEQESDSKKKIIIDIPRVPQPADKPEQPLASEPKKRGRKPKKKSTIEIVPTLEEESAQPKTEPEDSKSTTITRPALAEKSSNTTSPPKSDLDLTPKPTPETTPAPPDPPKPTTTTSISPRKSKQASPSLSSLLIKPRIGLSRSTRIPSLLRKLDRNKEPPRIAEKKEKLSKKQKEMEENRKLEMEVDGVEDDGGFKDRGADGMLVEWDF